MSFKRAQIHLLTMAIFFAVGRSARADEFETLRLRWREMLTQGTNASLSSSLYQNWINSLGTSAQSYWNTLNTGPTRTYLWTSYQDLGTDSSDITGTYSRLRTMALAYSVRDSALEGNTGLRAAIISGLDWMYANHYNATSVIFDNWFDFEIATPLLLNDITVLLYSNLSPAQLSNYMAAIEHFTPTPFDSSITTNLTAANKIWQSLVVGVRGVIVQDSNKIALARQGLSDVFPYVTTGDGFYADGSFIFHNEFAYNAGYGVELLDSTGALMQLLQGSTWQITDPAHTNVFRWVHDSFMPFVVRGAAMEMVDGRYHTRNGDGHERGQEVIGAILRVAQVAPPADAAAYKSFAKGIIQSDTYRNFLTAQSPPYNVWASAALNDTNIAAWTATTEHRQFPGMDRVLHRTPSWTFGLSMSSSRVANYESTRGENLKGWYTGEGMTYLYDGDAAHYSDNFWSTVDPYRMPGTTVEMFTRTNGSGDSYRSPNNQVGGASILGRYGVAAMHLNTWVSTLSARKSWFLFDNEIVCVGNSISGGDTNVVETIVENRRLGLYGNNAFTVNGVAKPSGPGWAETMAGTSWAHLAGTTAGADIGYFFPPAATVKALRESRSGAMKDINTTYGSATKNTRHYLTMYFDHGTNPSNGTYSYVLLPGMSASEVAAYAGNPDVVVLQNNSIATAVRESRLGITAVNYWRDTSNQVAGTGLSFDHKAAAIFKNDGTFLEVGVSDPTQTNTVGINVDFTNSATAVLWTDSGVKVLQTSPLKICFNTSNTFGATLRARFAVGPILSSNLAPVADAHVQNGSSANSNFGDSSTLAVKSGGATQSRETYLRFDLSSIPGTILQANLRLVTRTSVDEPIFHALSPVADDSWIESGAGGITWNTRPAPGPTSVVWQVLTTNQTLQVPVTALAQQVQFDNHLLSVSVASTGTNSTGMATNGGFVSYGSRETGTALNRPQLAVGFLRTAPSITLSIPAAAAPLNAPASVTLSAEAQDDGGVSLVEFYSGATRIGQALNPPYSLALQNLGASNYTFTAVATDGSGLSATSAPVVVAVHLPEPAGRGTGLQAEYFHDRALNQLFQARLDTNINFNWGNSAPIVGMSPNDFSVRWTGKIQARQAGVHQFHTVSDEGVRLWVDGRLLIDNWAGHFQTEDTGSIVLVPGRYYDITMEYYEGTFSAVAQLHWTQPGMAREVVPTAQLYPADAGLRGAYYSGVNFNVPVFTRIDEAVNFIWNTNSPDPTALPGAYSARWTGKVKANGGGLYQFFTLSDEGVRLWINGQLIISNWSAHAWVEDSGSLTLAAGQFYDVTLEYFNVSGVGAAVLSWIPPGESKQVIPSHNLTPHQNNNSPVLTSVPNQTAVRNAVVSFTASAADVDGHALTYSLDAGAPAGASVHLTSGAFSWAIPESQPFGPQTVTLRVTDSGSPMMTDAQTFVITVLTNPALSYARSAEGAVFSWPESAGSAQLYGATNLAPPVSWTWVTNAPVLSNGQWRVVIPTPTNAAQFYRLQTP
jgi:hyaluronate lyase